MSKGQRHHYIPKFYLKQWGDPKKGGRPGLFNALVLDW